MITEFIKAVETALIEIEKFNPREVTIFHHNDSDGLSSGAILAETFRRKDFAVSMYCLEKPYPPLLKKIFESDGKAIIFADFAGRIAPLISGLNRGRNLILILDHHVAEKSTDPRVFNLDPELFGLKGDRDISASTTCYIFSKVWDERNADLSRMATIGAVGDGFFVDGKLVNANREAALEAERRGFIEITERDWGEEYILVHVSTRTSCREFGRYLDILGGVGYQEEGPALAVEACLKGSSEKTDNLVRRLKAMRKEIFEREIKSLRSGTLEKTDHIQWFNMDSRFSPMGVKMVGIFCEEISSMDFIDKDRYIAGFQVIPDLIPGFGKIDIHHTKVSMRVPGHLRERIISKEALGLDQLLPEATARLGGFSDACHSLTAATVVEIGQEKELIQEMEKILNSLRR